MSDIRALDRRAVQDSVEMVGRATPGHLAGATPCDGWDLRTLLGHMTAQHHGFAAAARGEGGDLSRWAVRESADPIGDYAAGATTVTRAFTETRRETVDLAEFAPVVRFPTAQAIGFHLIDYVVHTWDVAASLGLAYRPDADLLPDALEVALAVPDGASRTEPGASFRPALKVFRDSADPFERLLAHLGRDPRWNASPG